LVEKPPAFFVVLGFEALTVGLDPSFLRIVEEDDLLLDADVDGLVVKLPVVPVLVGVLAVELLAESLLLLVLSFELKLPVRSVVEGFEASEPVDVVEELEGLLFLPYPV